MKSTNRSIQPFIKFGLDLGGVLLLLFVGLLLMTEVWLDLYWRIVPRPPIISNLEFQGSTVDSLYKRSIDNGYEYETELFHVERSSNERNFLYIKQTTTWYTSPEDALYAWQNPKEKINDRTYYAYSFRLFSVGDKSSFDEFDLAPLPDGVLIPSSLKCRGWDEHRRTCVYFGYDEHWFTQIWFMSEDKSMLTEELMYELIEKAVKIMLEAPPPVQ